MGNIEAEVLAFWVNFYPEISEMHVYLPFLYSCFLRHFYHTVPSNINDF